MIILTWWRGIQKEATFTSIYLYLYLSTNFLGQEEPQKCEARWWWDLWVLPIHHPCQLHCLQGGLSARCGLETKAGGTAKYRILCLSLFFIDAMWFHCTSIRGGDTGPYCEGKMMNDDEWMECRIKAPNDPSRESRPPPDPSNPNSCPLCWSCWGRVN